MADVFARRADDEEFEAFDREDMAIRQRLGNLSGTFLKKETGFLKNPAP